MSLPSDTRDYNAPSKNKTWTPWSLCSVLCCLQKMVSSWCSSLKFSFIYLKPNLGTLASYPHLLYLYFMHCYLSSLNWDPRPHLCGDVPYFMSLLLCFLPAVFLQLSSEMELGDVLPCEVYPALPVWCDGRNAHLSLCTGSSERIPRCQLNRQRLKSHYHSSSSWFYQVLATSWESIIFCVPLNFFLENILFLGLESSHALPAAKTVIIYG